MSEKRTRYNELLGVPNSIRDPDLYQLLGLDRPAFDPALVEERFRERMGTLQAIKSPKHKSFIEFLKGELRRARTVLTDERQRAAYDQELFEDRREQLTRILEVVVADGVLGVVEEQRIAALAAEVGLTPDETEGILVEELRARGARRDSSPGVLTGARPRPDPSRSASPSDIARAIARTLPPGAPPATGKQRLPAPPLPRRAATPPPPPEDDEEEEIVAELVEEAPPLPAAVQPWPASAPVAPPSSGWGRVAPPKPAGVCSSCLSEVAADDLARKAAERLPDGRLHCPTCFNRLVAGLICCACYQRITRSDMKTGRLKVVNGRACHGHCAGG